jgi:hypothetical protein
MARPRSTETSIPVEVGLSPKLLKYLDQLKGKEGFGSSRPDIIRTLIWKEINRLIEVGRLKEIE